MFQISKIMKWLAMNRVQAKKIKPVDADNIENVNAKCSLKLVKNDAVAVIAYGEVIENMGVNQQFIDALLVDEMSMEIDIYKSKNENTNSKCISKALLPKAKKIAHDYYKNQKNNYSDYSYLYQSVHEECDIDLMKILTHVYAKSFIKQCYRTQTAEFVY